MKYNPYKLSKHGRYQYRYSPVNKPETLRTPDPGEERADYYERLRRKFTPEQLRRLGWTNIAVIGCALALFFLASLFVEKPVRSVIEKRDLARFPAVSSKALFSGSLTRDVETWYADTFPLRDAFVGLSAVVDEAHGASLPRPAVRRRISRPTLRPTPRFSRRSRAPDNRTRPFPARTLRPVRMSRRSRLCRRSTRITIMR